MAEQIKISELATVDISLSDFIVKANASGVASKNTIKNLSILMSTTGDIAFKGKLLIADTPSIDGWYFAGESGTYTNAGSLVVDITSNLVIIIVSDTQTSFSKVDIPISISLATDGENLEGSTDIFNGNQTFTQVKEEVLNPFKEYADRNVLDNVDLWYYNVDGVNIGDVFNPALTVSNSLDSGSSLCKEGDRFYLKIKGASAGRAYVFVNSLNEIISVSPDGADYYDTPIFVTAPTNAYKVYFNHVKTGKPNSYVTKVSVLNEKIFSDIQLIDDSLYQRTEQLFNNEDYVEGFYGNDGVNFQSRADLWTSGFIPVEEGKTYKRTNINIAYYVYAYDVNKDPVVVDNGNVYWNSITFENNSINSTVKYVRIIFSPDNIDTSMLTLSSTDTSVYIPYLESKIESNKYYLAKNYQSEKKLGTLNNQQFNTDYSHVIFYGQSLSMGWESSEALTTTPVDGCYMIGDRVWINQGNDNSVVLNPLIATIGASCGESPAVSSTNIFKTLFDKLNRRSGQVEFIATNCGEGGKSIERLSKESTNGTNYYNTLFETSINRAKLIADNNSKTISCPYVVYMQGEYNYVSLTNQGLTPSTDATSDKDTYKALLLTLKNNMQSDIMTTYGQTKKPLFVISQVAGSYINNDSMSINEAQREFAEENDDVILLNPTYQTPDYSNGHLSSNGYRWYGEYIAKSLYFNFFENQKSRVSEIKDVEVIESGTKILAHCNVVSPPLVFDDYTVESIDDYGFFVKDDTGEVNISKIEIIQGTSILLHLERSLDANAFINYGGKDRTGGGNVRDSEEWSSFYEYANETGFTPPKYTPLDKDGNNLYGKKYPLKNWLISYYKELN